MPQKPPIKSGMKVHLSSVANIPDDLVRRQLEICNGCDRLEQRLTRTIRGLAYSFLLFLFPTICFHPFTAFLPARRDRHPRLTILRYSECPERRSLPRNTLKIIGVIVRTLNPIIQLNRWRFGHEDLLLNYLCKRSKQWHGILWCIFRSIFEVPEPYRNFSYGCLILAVLGLMLPAQLHIFSIRCQSSELNHFSKDEFGNLELLYDDCLAS